MGNGHSVFKDLNYGFCGMVSVICNCCFCIKTQRNISLEYEVWDDRRGNQVYVLKYSGSNYKP
jgi:hypothetical protein